MSCEYSCSLSVIGAGSYGTSLAQSTASKGLPVMLWSRNAQSAATMQQERFNSKYLPNVKLSDNLTISSDLESVVKASQNILVVVPSHTFADVLKQIKPFLKSDQRVAWATKGLDKESGKLLIGEKKKNNGVFNPRRDIKPKMPRPTKAKN